MKSVWMINHSSHTPTTGKWTRHYSLARYLAPLGWSTRVITASVDRHGIEQPLASGEKFRHVEHEGFSFTYIRTPAYRGHGIGRIRNMLVFLRGVVTGGPHEGIPKPDVIVGCTVHPFAALAGAILANRYRVPFFFEVRDLWPETLIQLGLTGRRSIFSLLLGALEKYLYRRADRIISTLPNIHRYLDKIGLPSDKVRWITNGIDFATLPEYSPPLDRASFRLMYIGSLAHSYGLHTLLDAMSLVKQRLGDAAAMELHLVGDGELREELEARAAELNLENVRFPGPVSRDEVPKVAAEADAFVILVRDLPELYCYGISMNKLTEYLAIGRPVLISVGVGVNNMVAEAEAGITVRPDNPEALASAIQALTAMSHEERLAMGRRGRQYAQENLSYRSLAQRYQTVLEEVTSPGPSGTP